MAIWTQALDETELPEFQKLQALQNEAEQMMESYEIANRSPDAVNISRLVEIQGELPRAERALADAVAEQVVDMGLEANQKFTAGRELLEELPPTGW